MESSAEKIIVKYDDLVAGNDISDLIKKAYGPHGHGILFVQGIPGYSEIRTATLLLFFKLANLPQEILKKYKRPDIFHSRGWSHGVEKFQGKIDTSKASYYINGATDEGFQVTPENAKDFTVQEQKFFCRNKWIEEIPEIEANVKALCKIMIDVGALLARQIDAYAHSQISTYPLDKLHNIITNGSSHVGRMLHYYPFQSKGDTLDDWCGWHNDHGSLTALTSALYTDQKGQEIKFPVKTGGLFAKNREADQKMVAIPPEMLAFQLGESTQIHTGGHLEATPHCVVRSEQLAGKKISRNTFALFLQPDPLEIMAVPEGASPTNVTEKQAYKVTPIEKRWDNGIPFKDFHKRTIQFYS